MQKQQNSLTTIAKTINRSLSTISREIKRNTGKLGYYPKQANEFANIKSKVLPLPFAIFFRGFGRKK